MMRKFLLKKLILLSLTLLGVTQISSQTQKMTLKECIIYAIENSPDAKIEDARDQIRRSELRESYLNFIPSVTGNIGAGSNFGRSIDPETNIYSNSTSFSNSYTLSGSVYLFNGFTILNNYKVSKIAQLSGAEESQKIEDELSLKVIQAYHNVLYALKMVSLVREQSDESKALLKKAEVLEELGLTSSADLLQAQAKVASDEYNVTMQENILNREALNLKYIMFYPLDSNLALDTANFPSLELIHESYDSANLFSHVNDRVPQIKISRYNVEALRLNHNTAKWRVLPSIYLNGGYSTGYMISNRSENSAPAFWDQIRNKQGQYIFMGINIPIFNSLSRHTAVSRSRYQLRIAELEHNKTVAGISAEISKAIDELNGTIKEIDLANKRLSAQSAAQSVNIRRFEEGLITFLELQGSSNALLASKAELLNATLKYSLIRRVVDYYNGISYLSQQY
ncbi:MAG: TolC family protein [Bacteroidales bacterium]|nr:TolC family protein [Bacteroidales bacterium]